MRLSLVVVICPASLCKLTAHKYCDRRCKHSIISKTVYFTLKFRHAVYSTYSIHFVVSLQIHLLTYFLPTYLLTYILNLLMICMYERRQLSRHLVGLWVTGHPTAMALLKRIMVCMSVCLSVCLSVCAFACFFFLLFYRLID